MDFSINVLRNFLPDLMPLQTGVRPWAGAVSARDEGPGPEGGPGPAGKLTMTTGSNREVRARGSDPTQPFHRRPWNERGQQDEKEGVLCRGQGAVCTCVCLCVCVTCGVCMHVPVTCVCGVCVRLGVCVCVCLGVCV